MRKTVKIIFLLLGFSLAQGGTVATPPVSNASTTDSTKVGKEMKVEYFVEKNDDGSIIIKDSLGRSVKVQLPQEAKDSDRYNIRINKALLDKMFPNREELFNEKEQDDELLSEFRDMDEIPLDQLNANGTNPNEIKKEAKPKPEEAKPKETKKEPNEIEEKTPSDSSPNIEEERASKKIEFVKENPKQGRQKDVGANYTTFGGNPPSGGQYYMNVQKDNWEKDRNASRGGDSRENRLDAESKNGESSDGKAPYAQGDTSLAGVDDHLSSLLFTANVYYHQKRYIEALDLLNEAEFLSPNDARTKMMKGSLFYRLGWPDLAVRFWSRALALNPKYQILRYYIERAKREVESYARAYPQSRVLPGSQSITVENAPANPPATNPPSSSPADGTGGEKTDDQFGLDGSSVEF